ncbi:MAG TPA: sensor histidine kinase, partial [Rubrivivax sp.]|nr:sensor histidine kinase [Rubrivivax sp.]
MDRPPPPDTTPSTGGAETRPGRGWPASGQPPALDFCHPALALRAVLLVQGVLAVGTLLVAGSLADWALRTAANGFVGLGGTLLWLVAVCTAQRWLRGGPALRRGITVPALGALAALLGWLP